MASNLAASTSSGNGYSLDYSTSGVSYQLEGNGYTALQSVTPVYGALVGNGYSAVTTSATSPILVAQSAGAGESGGRPVESPSVGSGYTISGGNIIYTDASGRVQTSEIKTVVSNVGTASSIGDELDRLIEPFIRSDSQGGLSELYQSLGTVINDRAPGESVIPVVIDIATKVFNSKSTFSFLTLSVIALLFLALGVSVFGYKEMHKIISTAVCVGSLFGYYTTSEIYLLPAFLGLVVLAVFLIRQKEREVVPIEKDVFLHSS